MAAGDLAGGWEMTNNNLAVELVAKAAAQDIVKTKEDVIRLTLNRLLGEGQYTLEDVKDHGKFVEKKDKPEEQIFHFDGRDIIWFGKPKIDIFWTPDKGLTYTAELPFEILIVEGQDDEVTIH